MAKLDILDILRSKQQTPLEFDFDNLIIPPMHVFLSQEDIDALRGIATSLRLSSKIEIKYKMIDDIMKRRGFKRFSAGTNRVVYSFLEDTRFVVKIAVDRVGMQDNPLEYENQRYLRPYCAKMFYISPCGTVGFAERVLPIKNKEEFRTIAGDVFDIIIHKILGDFVMEDIGTKYFMNWGIRKFYSPVLLDYPFLYKLDGKKLYCTKEDPITGLYCNGEIDYDVGFNHLICQQCGKIYLATDLRDNSVDNKIIIKGGNEMKVELRLGDKVISSPIPQDEVMTRPKNKKPRAAKGLAVKLVGGEQDISLSEENNNCTNNENEDLDFDTKSKFINDDNNSSNDQQCVIGNNPQTENDPGLVAGNSTEVDEESDSITTNSIDPKEDLDSVNSNSTDINKNNGSAIDNKSDSDEESDDSSNEESDDVDNNESKDQSTEESDSEKKNTESVPENKAPIKRAAPKRDSNGRFVSNKPKKENKGGTNRIPAK